MTRSHSGFTLIELMIAVVVICILLVLGLPSFQGMMRSTRVATQTNDFIGAVNLARAEAIRNNINAGICPAVAPAPAVAACGTDWNQGWVVFADLNNNGTVDAPTEVIRRINASTDLTLVTNPAGTGTIIFNPRGMSTAPADVTFVQTLNKCESGFMGNRTFKLLQVGQLTVSKGTCP
jgi:type IV fimbrial biogenesis protein FimT